MSDLTYSTYNFSDSIYRGKCRLPDETTYGSPENSAGFLLIPPRTLEIKSAIDRHCEKWFDFAS
jgi:hypothetical protein